MFGLPYDEVWALDFEYISEPGAQPVPVCMVAKELNSGRLIRLWQDDLPAGHHSAPMTGHCLSPITAQPRCPVSWLWDGQYRPGFSTCSQNSGTKQTAWPCPVGVVCWVLWPGTTSGLSPAKRNTNGATW